MTNEVLQTIKSRRTVRAYRPDAVPEELLQAVLEAGTYAPTGRGRQSPTIIAVTSEGYRQKISELNAAVLGSDSDPYYGAPVIILVLADGTANTFVEDGSCVLENMMLAAASLGLGSVWVHREREIFDSEEGKALLQAWGLPETLRGVGSIALGYPAGAITKRQKERTATSFAYKDKKHPPCSSMGDISALFWPDGRFYVDFTRGRFFILLARRIL